MSGVAFHEDDVPRIRRVVRSFEEQHVAFPELPSDQTEFCRAILTEGWAAASVSDRDWRWAAITQKTNRPCWLLRATEAIDTEEPRSWLLSIDGVDLPLLEEGVSAESLQAALRRAGFRQAVVAGYGFRVANEIGDTQFSLPIYSVIIPDAFQLTINGDEVSEGRCPIESIVSRWQITGRAIQVNTLWPLSTDLYCGQAVFCRAWAGVGWVLLSSECWEPS